MKAALAALLLVGCGYSSDPRDSVIVVKDPELLAPTIAAVAWWSAATDASSEIATACESGRACATVRLVPEDFEYDGQSFLTQHDGEPRDADIVIRTGLDRIDQQSVIAHELGHSYGVPHVNDPTDVMWEFDLYGTFPCIGPKTLAWWHSQYREWGRVVCMSGAGGDK